MVQRKRGYYDQPIGSKNEERSHRKKTKNPRWKRPNQVRCKMEASSLPKRAPPKPRRKHGRILPSTNQNRRAGPVELRQNQQSHSLQNSISPPTKPKTNSQRKHSRVKNPRPATPPTSNLNQPCQRLPNRRPSKPIPSRVPQTQSIVRRARHRAPRRSYGEEHRSARGEAEVRPTEDSGQEDIQPKFEARKFAKKAFRKARQFRKNPNKIARWSERQC